MKKTTVLLFCLLLVNGAFSQQASTGVSTQAAYKDDMPFLQEYHEPYPVGKTAAENNVKSIAVDGQSTVWIATAVGIFSKTAGSSTWQPLLFAEADKGPAFAVAVDEKGTVWMGTWNGVYCLNNNLPQLVSGTNGPISVVCAAREGLYALGPNGVWLCSNNIFTQKNYAIARSLRNAVSDGQGGIWVASDVGLYHANNLGTTHYFKPDVLLSAGLKGLATQGQQVFVAGLGGITVLENGRRQRAITPKQGCPSIYTNCVKIAPDGTLWVGTKVGLVRFYANGTHSLRFSQRWLVDDHVNDIAFDAEGNAWVATEQGVSAIKHRAMTLAAKQDFFYDILMRRHIRQPWIAGQCHLQSPGDTAHFTPEDDDNDGEYTGNYLAMESFRYAATHSADAREKAKKAFHFLQQLREVTGGDGFFARTMVPAAWANGVHDTNVVYSERERAQELVNEPRFKPVEVRWHASADGQWLWKGDASSDEWCGHMMGYYFYYTLAADEQEKTLVAQHVAALADHLIAHNFSMMDVDGSHTRWGVWSPDALNRDPEWLQDRSENSMELLAFLKLAYHVTGQQKYQQQYLHLIKDEHYLDNMAALVDQNPAWFIYFDVTMQAYLYPILLHCEQDPKLLAFYQQHVDHWMENRKDDKNPLLNFLYCYARGQKTELAASMEFLVDTPLDLVDWPIDHTKREDVQLVHTPVLDDVQVNELPPASIRSTVRWDKNPWVATSGNPTVEREPVFWLYPYWMARYLKMIE